MKSEDSSALPSIDFIEALISRTLLPSELTQNLTVIRPAISPNALPIFFESTDRNTQMAVEDSRKPRSRSQLHGAADFDSDFDSDSDSYKSHYLPDDSSEVEVSNANEIRRVIPVARIIGSRNKTDEEILATGWKHLNNNSEIGSGTLGNTKIGSGSESDSKSGSMLGSQPQSVVKGTRSSAPSPAMSALVRSDSSGEGEENNDISNSRSKSSSSFIPTRSTMIPEAILKSQRKNSETKTIEASTKITIQIGCIDIKAIRPKDTFLQPAHDPQHYNTQSNSATPLKEYLANRSMGRY